MIAPHILLLSLFLSFAWGWHTIDTITEYREYRTRPNRIESRVAQYLRDVVCAVCLESICIAYVLRTAIVLLGFGDQIAGQLLFFVLLGVNIPGALYAIISRRGM